MERLCNQLSKQIDHAAICRRAGFQFHRLVAGERGVTIGRRLTQAELAGMVGTTRESVNKWLGFYERQGMIQRHNGLIKVIQPQALRKRIY